MPALLILKASRQTMWAYLSSYLARFNVFSYLHNFCIKLCHVCTNECYLMYMAKHFNIKCQLMLANTGAQLVVEIHFDVSRQW